MGDGAAHSVTAMTKGRLRRMLLRVLLVGLATLLALLTFVLWPLPESLLDRSDLLSLRITDRSGRVMRELRSREDGRSLSLPADPLPPLVRAAFIAIEDRRFGQHPGVDPVSVARATLQNLRQLRVVSGASTIAQQLARQVRPHSRTLPGKLYEMAWGLRLTHQLPPEVLLREYLNRVPLGNSLLGVEAAAQTYFSRPARTLSPGQAALLAGMAASPARFDPYRHPEAARARMKRVLAQMHAQGSLTAEEFRVAQETPLDLVASEKVFEAPHVTAWLVAHLERLGLQHASEIETTLDASLQAAVEDAVRRELKGLADKRVGQAAVLVVDNQRGDVLAYVGSANFLDDEHGGQNDGVRAQRQPGSALKPFAYGLALGAGYSPASVLSDVETRLETPGGGYVPQNYDRRLHGPVRLRAALANSYNVPAVKITEALGPARVLKVLHDAGFESLTDSPEHYGVGLVLGNGDVTLWEAARAYRGLALGGTVEPLTLVRAARGASGEALTIPPELKPRRFLPAPAVGLLTDILSDELARAPAFGMDNALRLPFAVAVKTGTSRAHVDNWTLGFTRERTVAVWVGNFDGTAMEGVSGITGAGPLFKRVMIQAMQGIQAAPLITPQQFAAWGVQTRAICPLSGSLRTDACPGVMQERFLPGTVPSSACRMHTLVAVDPRSGAPVPCETPGRRLQSTLSLGRSYAAWAHREGLESQTSREPCPEGAAPPPGSPSPSSGQARGLEAEASTAIALLHPAEGDDFSVDPGLPLETQSIPILAQAPPGTGPLELRVGSDRLVLSPPYRSFLPPRRGTLRLELWAPGATTPASVVHIRVR